MLDVASGLKYGMRIWERDDPWINGAGFSRGYARFVTLTEREVSSLVEVTILRDTVSVIWHYGRSLAEGRPPDRKRLEDATRRHGSEPIAPRWKQRLRVAVASADPGCGRPPVSTGDGRRRGGTARKM